MFPTFEDAVAEGAPDSLAVVGIFLEVMGAISQLGTGAVFIITYCELFPYLLFNMCVFSFCWLFLWPTFPHSLALASRALIWIKVNQRTWDGVNFTLMTYLSLKMIFLAIFGVDITSFSWLDSGCRRTFTRISYWSMKYLPLDRCLTQKKRTFLKQRNTWRTSRRRLPASTIIPTRLSPFWKISTSPQFIGGTKMFCLRRRFHTLHKVKQVPRKPDHTFM